MLVVSLRLPVLILVFNFYLLGLLIFLFLFHLLTYFELFDSLHFGVITGNWALFTRVLQNSFLRCYVFENLFLQNYARPVPFLQVNRNKNKTNRDQFARIFPRFTSEMCIGNLFWVFVVGSLDCLYPLAEVNSSYLFLQIQFWGTLFQLINFTYKFLS